MDVEKQMRIAGGRAESSTADTEEVQSLPRRQVVLTMAGVMLALFLASLDQTIVGTAMPRIIADLKGFNHYTWVTTAYLVASTTVVPISGRLTDMYGRKWFYVAGISVFLVASALAGLSQNMAQLIIFRGLQGIGGGMMIANAFVTIGDLFPPAERGKYQGLLSAMFGLSSIIGPTLGGLVTDHLSWHWIFYINIPTGVPIIALFIAFFPQVRPTGRKHQLDYLGMTALVLSVVPLLLAFSWGGVQYAWSSAQVIGFMTFGVLMATLFVVIESHVPEPIIPLAIFRNRVVSISLVTTFLTGFGMFGGIIFIPLFFQAVLGASATSSGSFLTPMMLGIVIGGVISGQALSRLGGHYRVEALIGLTIMGVGGFLLSRMSVDTSYGQAVANIVLMGFGLGMTLPIYTIAVQNAVPRQLMGVATSSTQFFRTIGGTLGLGILGSVLTNRFASELTSNIPAAVQKVLPPERVSELAHNPQALVSPEAQTQLQAGFNAAGPDGARLLEQLLMALRHALASAISEVFFISLVAVALAWTATLFLKEIPLRQERRVHRETATTRPGDGPVGTS